MTNALTPMEARVLAFVAAGLFNKQIAHELGVGESTVKAHVSAALRKTGAASRCYLILRHHGVDTDAMLAQARALAAAPGGSDA